MAPITLPPSFHTSFWSPDYRSGVDTLFKHLEAGCLEDDEVAAFIETEMRAHHVLSETLSSPPSTPSDETTSSLQHTLLSLRQTSRARAESHRALANDLANSVWLAFSQWKDRHKDRIKGSKEELMGKEGVVTAWEKEVKRLAVLKQTYLVKSRHADDSEDDAKFAPAQSTSAGTDSYTSPKQPQTPNRLSRSGTVSDRISEKLKAASVTSPQRTHRTMPSIDEKVLPSPPGALPLLDTSLKPVTGDDKDENGNSPSSPAREEPFIPPSEPDGKPTIHSGPPAPPSKAEQKSSASAGLSNPILLSGLSLPPNGVKELLNRFESYLLSTPAPYSPNPPQTSTTRSNTALATRHRTTILGAYEKTFSGEEIVEWLRQHVEGFGGDWERCEDAAAELHSQGYFSRIGVGRGFEPTSETYFVLKLNSAEGSSLGSPLSPAVSGNINSLLKSYQSYLPGSLGSDEPAHIRARKEAVKADEAYKHGVEMAEEKRLLMVEKMEVGLRNLGMWERERMNIVKKVLKQYDDAVQKLPTRLADVQKGSDLLVEAFHPEADMAALIEGNRTGSYRPQPHIYESVESDLPEVNFGIDLRKWSGDQGWKALVNAPNRPKGAIPDVLTALLAGLAQMRGNFPDDDIRKGWIFEVPLSATHGLRNLLNDPKLPLDDMIDRVKHFNPFVAAATVKLYMLELNPPILGWEGWEDAKAVYPSVGADQERDMTSAVGSVLARLPGVHLFVLDAVIKHLREMIDATKTEETNEIYITKLALSVGRTILRPQYETELTIQDRTPSLFLADLINNYTAIFPALVERKKKDSDRVMPVRKRTALVDQRISRSRLSSEVDPHELLNQQKTSIRAVSPVREVSKGLEGLGLGQPIPSQAKMVSPEKMVSPDEKEGRIPEHFKEEKGDIQVVPPTPELRSEPQNSDQLQEDSVTAALLANEPDSASGASALKRAASGETSRLRGPRGARGPRPAPGRVSSTVGRSTTPTPSDDARTEDEKPTTPVRSTGAFGHGSRPSVSAAIAAFENGGKK